MCDVAPAEYPTTHGSQPPQLTCGDKHYTITIQRRVWIMVNFMVFVKRGSVATKSSRDLVLVQS